MKFANILRNLATVALFFAFSGALLAQGVTTSSMDGVVRDAAGETLIGANIVAVHTPTGTVYGNATNLDGIFRLPYMKVGGPYKVTVSYTGYEDFVRENIYLDLGQSFKLNVTMNETAIALEGITVTASRNAIIDGGRDGQSTTVDEELINRIPTLSRSIADFARFNPLANVTEGSDGFAFSIGGQNERYNSIYIDGAVSNDAFGLADGGTDGGQTGVSPFSLDAIETFTIAAAPFDIRQSGFAGGTVNAVTRSGTNEFEGSAYYLFRNESLSGQEITSDQERGDDLDDFSARTYGFRLGGPIIKNKLFFFVNAELQDDDSPQPFDIDDYRGNLGATDVQNISNFVQSNYGYDVGVFDNNTAFLESTKLLAKIDWNINEKHNLTLRHSYVRAENLEARNSGSSSINFINGSESFISTTNSTALELSSVFNANISNRLIIGFKTVRDDRDPLGDPFPTVFLEDGDDGSVNFGAERFSTANLLNQDVFTITNDFSIFKGRHNALFGINAEFFSAGNLFIRNNFGRYRWFDDDGMTGVDRFLAGMPASQYERSFSQVDNLTGDESSAIADFNQALIGFYIQDEFQVSDNFTLTGGLRFDFPIWSTDQPINEQFNTQTIPAIESFGWDLKGARTGSFIGNQLAFAPRLAWNWDVNGDQKTQVRGGIGVFTSRIPLVWPGGAYNNYGFNIGEVAQNNVAFNPDINAQPVRFDDAGNPVTQVDLNNPIPSGQVDLFAEDFRLPQVMKLNLAIDQKLPWGVIGTLEGIYTKTINDVRYYNLNIKPNVRSLSGAGPDSRPLYEGTQAGFGDDVIDPTYTYIMLADNTSDGYAWNFVASLNKTFDKGFQAFLSYSFSDAYSVFPGTSSQNNSQWRGYHPALDINGFIGGRNGDADDNLGDPQRNPFAAGHRIFGQVSYGIEYAKFFRSSLSLSFNAQTAGHFSYVIGERNFNFVDDGGFDNNELFYVPNALNEIPLVDLDYNGQTFSPEQQYAILDQFIDDDAHLSDRRGNYAQRNGARRPMNFSIDARFLQDFYVSLPNGKRNTLQLSLDIFNLTNLLNPAWGNFNTALGSFGNFNVINMENRTTGSNTVPEYTINTALIDGDDPSSSGQFDNNGLRSSIWQMQIGLRYIFGR
ncbi:MAG: carboxypeptidase regulatory-like domain-containing protein [Bacteroidota bacterium]